VVCCATAGSARATARSSATSMRFFIFNILRVGGAWAPLCTYTGVLP